jgi:4-hydroxybenzoate polyprenyltransferase
MTILTQLVVLYAILLPSGLELALSSWQFIVLVSAVGLLTASGNVINDIYDVEIDQLNKPDKVLVGSKITENAAFYWYIGLTSIAVILGFILSNSIDKPIFSSVFIVVAFLLYSYAASIKSMPVVGNILISLLVGMVIIVTGIFELIPVITENMRGQYAALMKILVYFAAIAFVINLLREWIKDCEDVNGDKIGGRLTIALILGRQRAAKLISIITWMVVLGMIYIAVTYLYEYQISLIYWIFLLVAPLMYVAIQLWNADQAKKFHNLSMVIKLVLLLGIFYMFFCQVDEIKELY